MNFTALQPGSKVGGYEIKRLLGVGGFGMTYEGFNPITRNRVAIKELFPKGIVSRQGATIIIGDQRDQQVFQSVLKKFEDSTTKLAQLSHDNIVKVFDYIPGNNTGYMMMEYIEGDILAGVLEKSPNRTLPSEAEFARIFQPICDALGYVHANNLIHRDISPDNIMIDRTGRPVLIDFGAFKEMDQTNRASTLMVAREAYAPPEQGVVDGIAHMPYTDVYALGATMYETLAGEPPVRAGKRIFVKSDPYVPLGHKTKIPCSPALIAAIDQALRLQTEERPQSIGVLTGMMGWDATRLAPQRQTTGPVQGLDAESQAWTFIKDKSETRLVRDFLQRFPSGQFAFMARHKLAELSWAGVRDSNDINRIRMFATEYAGTGPADEAAQWLARYGGPPTVQAPLAPRSTSGVQPPPSPFLQPQQLPPQQWTGPVPQQPGGYMPPGPPTVQPGAYLPPPKSSSGGMAAVGKIVIGLGVAVGVFGGLYLFLQGGRKPEINTAETKTITTPAPTNTTTRQPTITSPPTPTTTTTQPRQPATIPVPNPNDQSQTIATTPPRINPATVPALARAPIANGRHVDLSGIEDFTACSDLCRQNSTCAAFNYYANTKECRLWGPNSQTAIVPPVNDQSRTITQTPPVITPTPQQSSIPPGSFRTVRNIETEAACQGLCRTTPGCGTPQYESATQECRLWAVTASTPPTPPKQIATAPTPPTTPAPPNTQTRPQIPATTGNPTEPEQKPVTPPPAIRQPAITGNPNEKTTPPPPRAPQTATPPPTQATVTQRIGTLNLTLDGECFRDKRDDGRFVLMKGCSGNRTKEEAYRNVNGRDIDACARTCGSDSKCKAVEFEDDKCYLFDSITDVFKLGGDVAVKR